MQTCGAGGLFQASLCQRRMGPGDNLCPWRQFLPLGPGGQAAGLTPPRRLCFNAGMKTFLLSVLVLLFVASCSPPPTVAEVITKAIKARRTVTLSYAHSNDDGFQVVEPHVLGTTAAGEPMLRAWFLRDIPKSAKDARWQLYVVKNIRSAELGEPFDWPRPDYKPGEDKDIKNVEAAL